MDDLHAMGMAQERRTGARASRDSGAALDDVEGY